jgi:hypothetical protein
VLTKKRFHPPGTIPGKTNIFTTLVNYSGKTGKTEGFRIIVIGKPDFVSYEKIVHPSLLSIHSRRGTKYRNW